MPDKSLVGLLGLSCYGICVVTKLPGHCERIGGGGEVGRKTEDRMALSQRQLPTIEI